MYFFDDCNFEGDVNATTANAFLKYMEEGIYSFSEIPEDDVAFLTIAVSFAVRGDIEAVRRVLKAGDMENIKVR